MKGDRGEYQQESQKQITIAVFPKLEQNCTEGSTNML